MTHPTSNSRTAVTGDPSKHQLTRMIWLAVFPDPYRPQPRPR
jgi:hypothetical protein